MSTIAASNCATRGGASSEDGKFLNQEAKTVTGWSEAPKALAAWLRADREAPRPPGPLPVRRMTAEELQHNKTDRVYRLGHSTVLLSLDGHYFLTDPVFSERASPVQWAGSRRFHPVPLSVDDLPDIKAVVISHDHYDHLDKAAVLELDSRTEYFLTPLKVGRHLRRWGIDAAKIIELDWWQSRSLGGVTLTATPAQHFSGRSLTDRDETLWAGWAFQGSKSNIFFSGDSGYFGGFREIGERLGPFDITMVEAGAYNELWSDIHMLPEQSVQAHLDLRGAAMLPIHNSTFDLSLHDWYEPLEQVHQLAEQNGVRMLTPQIGEPVLFKDPSAPFAWWRQYMPVPGTYLAADAL